MSKDLKDEFLMYPAKEICTSIVSLAPPRSGKTYIMIRCLWAWIEMGMFETIVCILPTFKNEMSDTYAGLGDVPNVYVFEAYHEHKIKKFVEEQEKQTKLYIEKKIKHCPRMLFICDDATGQKNLFKSKLLIKMVTENRHLHIHSWFLMHYAKGIISKSMRDNIHFNFMYPLKDELFKDVYNQFVDLRRLGIRKFEQFEEIYIEEVEKKHEYPSMLIFGTKAYDTNTAQWFESEDEKESEDEGYESEESENNQIIEEKKKRKK